MTASGSDSNFNLKPMRSGILLLVLLGLPAISLAASCNPAITNCGDCSDTTATADCNYCNSGYFKETAKTCKACPDGTGRTSTSAAVAGTETAAAVCTIKSAPQLKCVIASGRYACSTCATGSFTESAVLHGGEASGTGCSTDCKSFENNGVQSLVPQTETPALTSCVRCNSGNNGRSNCLKCKFAAATQKSSSGGTPGSNKQLTECTECANGYYLKNNADTTITPTCETCGANCKTCKDDTACQTCYPGWALDGTDKVNCLKSVAVSGNIIKAALISILALFIAW